MLTAAPTATATVRVRVGTPTDDAALRSLLANQGMGDGRAVRLEREPSLFDALDLDGSDHRLAVAEDSGTGEILGMGVRTTRTVFINGAPQRSGYLHLMRVRRNPHALRAMLTQGYRLLQEDAMRDDQACDFTTIMSENTAAVRLLTRGRQGLPIYRPLDDLTTFVLRTHRRRLPCGVREAEPADHNSIVDVMNRWNRQFQFMPCIGRSDLRKRGGRWLVYEINGRIVAACALWDQRWAKQIIISSNAAPRAFGRRGLNIMARLRGLPPMPRPDAPAPIGVIAHLGLDPERIDGLDVLLRGVLSIAAAQEMTSVAMIASARNPLFETLASRPAIRLHSQMYGVIWNEAENRLDGRPAQLESSMA